MNEQWVAITEMHFRDRAGRRGTATRKYPRQLWRRRFRGAIYALANRWAGRLAEFVDPMTRTWDDD